MIDEQAADEAEIYRIFGKNSTDLLKVSTRDNREPRNASFWSDQGPEEMRHIAELVQELSDDEVVEIGRIGGLIIKGTTKSELDDWLGCGGMDHLRSWMDEVGREDFYKVYNKRKTKS